MHRGDLLKKHLKKALEASSVEPSYALLGEIFFPLAIEVLGTRQRAEDLFFFYTHTAPLEKFFAVRDRLAVFLDLMDDPTFVPELSPEEWKLAYGFIQARAEGMDMDRLTEYMRIFLKKGLIQ